MTYRVLGIDESNHGRYPEIFVGVYSEIKKDSRKGEFPKIRRKIKSINSELSSNGQIRDYMCVVIPVEYTEYLTREQLGLVAISHLISFYDNIYAHETLDDVLIDGSKSLCEVDKIKEMISPHSPKIRCVPNGDRIFKVTNYADLVAHALFKEYNSKKQNKNIEDIFNEHLLVPDLENYINYFK